MNANVFAQRPEINSIPKPSGITIPLATEVSNICSTVRKSREISSFSADYERAVYTDTVSDVNAKKDEEILDLPKLLNLGNRKTFTLNIAQLSATAIQDKNSLKQIASSLKNGQTPNLIDSNNTIVNHLEQRAKVESDQFNDTAQIIQELVINGAEAKTKSKKEPTVNVNFNPETNTLNIKDDGKGMNIENFIYYYLRPHSGETDKPRGKFGNGKEATFGTIKPNDNTSFIESV